MAGGNHDQGASFDVPPGDYTVGVYRKNWQAPAMAAALEAAQAAGVDVSARTHDVVVLSPYDGATLEGALFLPAPRWA